MRPRASAGRRTASNACTAALDGGQTLQAYLERIDELVDANDDERSQQILGELVDYATEIAPDASSAVFHAKCDINESAAGRRRKSLAIPTGSRGSAAATTNRIGS